MKKAEIKDLELGQAKTDYERGVIAGMLLEKLAQVDRVLDRISEKLDRIEERNAS